MDKFAKLAALGAISAAVGIGALYVFLLWALRPSLSGGAVGATGGMDWLGWEVLAVAMLVPVGILAGVHVALGKQLRDGPRSPPVD
jgi:hypothetical protein